MALRTKQEAILFIGFTCWLWQTAIALAQSGDVARGERLYQRCYACHSTDPEEKATLQGPSLYKVIGRRAASIANFSYSPALTNKGEAGLVWAEDELDRFLLDPERAIPGNQMGFFGLPKDRDRADVIAYLKHQAKNER
jgi:cytochrome c